MKERLRYAVRRGRFAEARALAWQEVESKFDLYHASTLYLDDIPHSVLGLTPEAMEQVQRVYCVIQGVRLDLNRGRWVLDRALKAVFPQHGEWYSLWRASDICWDHGFIRDCFNLPADASDSQVRRYYPVTTRALSMAVWCSLLIDRGMELEKEIVERENTDYIVAIA